MTPKASIREATKRTFEEPKGEAGNITGLALGLLALSWLGAPLAWRSGDPPHAFLVLVIFGAGIGLYHHWRQGQGWKNPFGARERWVTCLMWALGAGVLLSLAYGLAIGLGYVPRWISFTFGNLSLGHPLSEQLASVGAASWRALFMALFGDEFVFRGILLPGLMAAAVFKGSWSRAIAAQALIYGLCVAGRSDGGSLAARFQVGTEAVLLGATLGFVFLRTGSVWATALARVGWDVLSRKLMSDIELPGNGLYHYVVVDQGFGWLKAGALLLPVVVLGWKARGAQSPLQATPYSPHPSPLPEGEGTRMGFAAGFCVLAAWTISVKFAVPIQTALSEGLPWKTYVLWDFWWIPHLYLAAALVKRWPLTWLVAVIISVVELAIVFIKLNAYLLSPYGGIWRAHWFYNKLVVLAIFCALMVWLLRPGTRQELATPKAISRND